MVLIIILIVIKIILTLASSVNFIVKTNFFFILGHHIKIILSTTKCRQHYITLNMTPYFTNLMIIE